MIEAVPEEMELKHDVFAELDACTPGHAILASTTSGLSITEIGEITMRPDQVVGFHFWPGSRLIEVIEGDDTSPETVQAAANFALAIRKTPVRAAECPGFVVDRVSLAQDLVDAYGDRFAADGNDTELKAFVEACLVLEEGIAGVRDIDLGLMMGAGMVPGPFIRADLRGLDDVLAALEAAEDEWGEHFEPPVILRRLVAQGRLGAKSGQGFYPYPQVESGYETAPVKLDMRGETAVVWLDNPPANSLGPAVIEGLERARGRTSQRAACGRWSWRRRIRRCSAPAPTSRRSRQWDVDSGRRAPASRSTRWAGSGSARRSSRSPPSTAWRWAAAARSRWRATSGSPARRRRSASRRSTSGSSRASAGRSGCRGWSGPAKALEMNTIGDPISADEAFEYGLVNRVVADHELFDTALAWARKVAGQAPVAIEQIKRVSHGGDLDEGLAAERDGFLHAFSSEDAREGIGAFIEKRKPEFKGR